MSINATSGVVKLLQELDYEQIQSLWIEITVKDQGVPSLESHAILTIDVKVRYFVVCFNSLNNCSDLLSLFKKLLLNGFTLCLAEW